MTFDGCAAETKAAAVERGLDGDQLALMASCGRPSTAQFRIG
jgi:hypothetical protein